MILEDDPFIALDMEGVMEDAGFNIVGPVASVPEAMKLLKDEETPSPDCALLDFYVSGGTSELLARELGRVGVPYIVLTGNAADARKAMADEKPIIRSKPVQVQRILDDVQMMLG
jgi:DNA-binding NtrC family response regulator